jgi:hypothetical protein
LEKIYSPDFFKSKAGDRPPVSEGTDEKRPSLKRKACTYGCTLKSRYAQIVMDVVAAE